MIKNKDYLICFDMDGVLISSMVIANEIFYDVVEKELGLPLHDYPQQKGLMALSFEDRLVSLWKDDIERKGISEDRIESALEICRARKMAADIPILPNARETVRQIADYFENMALVSSNREFVIDDTLNLLGLRQYFSKLTGIDSVQFSKPDPEIYKVTVEHFGILPQKALTFEDSTHGIHSAKGAGMKVVGVATGLETPEALQKAGADQVLKDFSEFSLDELKKLLEIL